MSARTNLLFARRSTAVTLVAPEDGGKCKRRHGCRGAQRDDGVPCRTAMRFRVLGSLPPVESLGRYRSKDMLPA